MSRRLNLVVLAVTAAACSPEPRAPGGSDASRALHALIEADWEYQLREHPDSASEWGDRRYDDRWGDHDLAAYARWEKHDGEMLQALSRIDRAALGEREKLDYDLFEKERQVALEGWGFKLYLRPISQLEGVQTASDLADEIPFDSVRDYESWTKRLAGFSKYVDDTIQVMREGIKQHIVHAKVVMSLIPRQLDDQIVDDPQKSPFFEPYKKFPGSFSAADRERLAREGEAQVRASVVPAFRRFKAFFTNEYLPACTDAVGAWQLPRGAEAYRYLARARTTTSLTPEQIHEMGLREVARIRAQMEALAKKVGFSGSLKELFTFLRTDPRFFYKSGDELLTAYRALAKRIDPKLTLVIGTLPRTPYGVEPVPDVAAPEKFTAYYRELSDDGKRPGMFMVNLYKPETRPKWEMMALSLHEAVPGHHLQIALAYELKDIPSFRKHADYTAFVEGWALYAESLGDEMGLYDDPYAKIGQLTYEMWRAVRLVVDTGMHLYKWDRERAIAYFLDNAAKTEHDVTNEVDRYIVWPGQALAYKVGELRIKELRARAEAKLGRKFDRRAFHDVVLGAGPLPLDVLEQRVDAWIARP